MDLIRKIREYFNNFFQERWKNYTTPQKILIAGSVVSVLVVLIVLLSMGLRVNYVVLVKNLSEKEAGTIAQKLDELGIPYKAAPNGTILVPDNMNVYSVRMRLATEGVLGTVSRGFEIMDNQPFGATSFDKQVKYQIALQGELERTISSLEAIKIARVHLTIPKYTYYVRGEISKPKASVMLVLEPGMDLTPKQIKGIMELVAGAVEGLDPSNVKVVDNNSRVLSDLVNLEQENLIATNKMELKKLVEDYYTKKIRSSLEQVYGIGNVVVMAEVLLDWTKIEKESKEYVPTNKSEGIIVSQQTETESIEGTSPSAGGPVGTEANIPPTYESFEGTEETKIERRKTITNYNVSEVYQKVIDNREGEILDKSITVFINESLANQSTASVLNTDIIKKAVANAINVNNDKVEIVITPFDKTVETEMMKEIERVSKQRAFMKLAFGVLLLTAAIVVLLYSMIRRIKLAKERRKIMMRRQELEKEIMESLKITEEALPPEEKELLELRQNLEQLSEERPEDVASVIRLWLAE